MALQFDFNNAKNFEQIVKCIQVGCVPEVSTDENHLENREKALLAHLEIAKPVLNKLNNLLIKLLDEDEDFQIKPRDILLPCLYLCGEHCQSNFPWSDIESHSVTILCMKQLCQLMHYSDIEELLTQVDISKVFIGLQCKLEKDNWKKYPAAVECFMWILKYLKVSNSCIFCLSTTYNLYYVSDASLKLITLFGDAITVEYV